MQDADEPVGELAQGGVVFAAVGFVLVVVGAGAGGGGGCAEGLGHEGVDEPVIVHKWGEHDFLLARGAADGAGAGVVSPGFRIGVAVGVTPNLASTLEPEDRSQAGLGHDDLSVRVLTKIRIDLPFCRTLTCSSRVRNTATAWRVVAA